MTLKLHVIKLLDTTASRENLEKGKGVEKQRHGVSKIQTGPIFLFNKKIWGKSLM